MSLSAFAHAGLLSPPDFCAAAANEVGVVDANAAKAPPPWLAPPNALVGAGFAGAVDPPNALCPNDDAPKDDWPKDDAPNAGFAPNDDCPNPDCPNPVDAGLLSVFAASPSELAGFAAEKADAPDPKADPLNAPDEPPPNALFPDDAPNAPEEPNAEGPELANAPNPDAGCTGPEPYVLNAELDGVPKGEEDACADAVGAA